MALNFNSIVKSVILENSRYELLKDRFTKLKKKGEKTIKPKLSLEKFNVLVKADPTTRVDGDEIKKAGTYVQWLLKQYLKLNQTAEVETEYGTPAYTGELTRLQQLFFEDLYNTTQDLKKYDRFKGQLEREQRDINKISMEKLNDLMLPFSLEKTKATKDEKKQASKTYEHPGGKVIFKGNKWSVIEISDSGKIGKDAACFYGGNHLAPSEGESTWCTASPGGSMAQHYLKQGPLYVVIPNNPESFMPGGPEIGKSSGLPANRYQFHFPSNQFMNLNDRQIDLVSFLNENPELKEIFKPEFAKGLTSMDGKKVNIDYPRDASSKYIALYGFDDLFNSLSSDITSFDFSKSSGGYRTEDTGSLELDIPEKLGDYKNLMALHFEGVLKSLPKSLGKLSNLQFLSIPNNPNLKSIPEEIASLPNLKVINIQGNPQLEIPEVIEKLSEKGVFISK